MRKSVRTELKQAPTSRRPTLRESLGAATVPEWVVFLKLAQCTNLSRTEQTDGGCGAAAGRVRRNAVLSADRRRFETMCQNQPWERFILF